MPRQNVKFADERLASIFTDFRHSSGSNLPLNDTEKYLTYNYTR